MNERATERLHTDHEVQEQRFEMDMACATRIFELFTATYPDHDFNDVSLRAIFDILRRPEVLTTVTQYQGQTSQLALEQVLATSVGQTVIRHELPDTGLVAAQIGSRPRSSTVGTQNPGENLRVSRLKA